MKFLKDKHIMVDIETLNSTVDAIILSIGACSFDFNKGVIDTFYTNVDPVSCKEYGLTSSRDTVKWWSTQPKEVLHSFKQPEPVSLVDALTQFHKFYSDSGASHIWAHGQFDIPIIELASSRCEIVTPWKYWNCMDNRTVMTILDSKVPRGEGWHNALADAIAQAKHLVTLFETDAF